MRLACGKVVVTKLVKVSEYLLNHASNYRNAGVKIDSNSTFLDFANSKIEIKVKAIESNQEHGSKPFLHTYLKTFYLRIQEFVKSHCNRG